MNSKIELTLTGPSKQCEAFAVNILVRLDVVPAKTTKRSRAYRDLVQVYSGDDPRGTVCRIFTVKIRDLGTDRMPTVKDALAFTKDFPTILWGFSTRKGKEIQTRHFKDGMELTNVFINEDILFGYIHHEWMKLTPAQLA